MTGDTEITARNDLAEAKFYEHRKKLMNFNIKLHTRIQILNFIVRSRLTYGCQTWNLNSGQKGRLDSCYTSMLRKIVRGGHNRKRDEWAYKWTNKMLLNLCKAETISVFSQRQKCRYLAHLLDTCITKRIVFNSDRSVRPGQQATTFLHSILDADGSNISSFARRAIAKEL